MIIARFRDSRYFVRESEVFIKDKTKHGPTKRQSVYADLTSSGIVVRDNSVRSSSHFCVPTLLQKAKGTEPFASASVCFGVRKFKSDHLQAWSCIKARVGYQYGCYFVALL